VSGIYQNLNPREGDYSCELLELNMDDGCIKSKYD
jgi:hypothetical protein